MLGRRKKPKSDDAQSKSSSRPSTYRDWDTIVPGEPMVPQPYAQPAYPAQPQAPAPAQPAAYTSQPQAPAAQPQVAYQQPAPQPQYQQPAAAAPPQAAVPQTPASAATGNPVDGTCTKCGGAFGQKAICQSCGTGRTACLVCGTKIWAGALTCSAHSNAGRR